ncbi:MAG: serine/threonine protein kinase [Deltaproteobacteria bacterium]|nr:serine/threonine protein kinase [Deltaproteobacteria bacterium]
MSVPTALGQYQLIRKIAAGGMAEVFLARQRGPAGFQREVVVKRLFHHFAENARMLRMFQDEAKILAVLQHPNVAQVYELGCDEGVWFFAMEHVRGPDLAEICRRAARARQWLPFEVSIAIIRQVAEGLHHAHVRRDQAGRALRLVHRDVTPSNVLVTFDGVVKILDFGVARSDVRRDTEAGRIRGTLSYMAPEQVRGRQVDCRADVFSLGVVLWELTTGSRLFRGNDLQIMTSIVERDAPAPSTRVPTYPTELEHIVMSMLARDPGSRMPDAATVSGELERFAITHGLPTGPHGIAAYLHGLMPHEEVYEAEGIVEPPRLLIVDEADARVANEVNDTARVRMPSSSRPPPEPTPGRFEGPEAERHSEPVSFEWPMDLMPGAQPGSTPHAPSRAVSDPRSASRPQGAQPAARGTPRKESPALELEFELEDEAGEGDHAYLRGLSQKLSDPEQRRRGRKDE